VIRSITGKAKEISPLLWIVAAGFVLYFARGPIAVAFGG
jgi:AGZA family xanthine/uracil permease-like MFS transporter